MILDELLHAIEIEITSSNDITDDIYENIKYALKIEYGFSSNNVCNYNLKPFAYKLLHILSTRLKEFNRNEIKTIIDNILIKGISYFPEHVEIYIAYAIKMFEKDENIFVNMFLNDTMYVKVKHELYIKFMMYTLSIIFIIVCIYYLCKDMKNVVMKYKNIIFQYKR